MNTKRNLRLCVYLISGVLWLIFSHWPAHAHKVTIFAWVEGDTVYTQSKFSGGRKAQHSTVAVYDTEGTRLLEGVTDENGEFAFKIPQKTALKVVLKASMGHLAEWTIPVEEIVSGGDQAAGSTSQNSVAADSEKTQRDPNKLKPETQATSPVTVHVDRQELQKMIDESLDRKLGPILKLLADSKNRDPGLAEIMGGIGYILGLVGVAMYVASRRRNDR